MLAPSLLFRGRVLLPEGELPQGALLSERGIIRSVGPAEEVLRQAPPGTPVVEAGDGFLAPGYIDLHVHGGAGADYMDGTREAFATVLRCHVRHGTTRIVPTTTVARHEQILEVLQRVREFKQRPDPAGARVVGAHFYGPYFSPEACGCHPAAALRPPCADEYRQYLEFAADLALATVAPELPNVEEFARACAQRGVRLTAGHSQATFEQVRSAIGWGVRHVDHLYCAMSDKTKLRQKQPYPMRGGLLEATLYFDELSTEVIADGRHLSADLLQLALKIKGPDRLALVTDCSRALDMPEGEYLFGPLNGGERFIHRDGVGVMPDGQALASSAQGMDHMVRTFAELTGSPAWLAVRLASLTPAQILGQAAELGSLEPGKRADVLVLDAQLRVQRVFIEGAEVDLSVSPADPRPRKVA